MRAAALAVFVTIACVEAVVRAQVAGPAAEVAPAPTVEIRGGRVVRVGGDGTTLTLDVGCTATAVLAHDDALHVGCIDRIVTFSASALADPIDVVTLPGELRSLYERDGRVWVEMTRVETLPLDRVAPFDSSPPLPPLPEPPSPARRRQRTGEVGRIVETYPDEVVIDLGSDDGVAEGDRIAFEVSAATHRRSRMARTETIAVGRVVLVDSDHAVVRLGLDERVTSDAVARLTRRPATASRVAPPRVSNVREIWMHARLLVPGETLGIGLLGEAGLVYRTDSPFTVGVRVHPLALAESTGGSVTAFAFDAFAAVDLELLEVGFGVGWATINEFDGHPGESSNVSLTQMARIGARDGLHVAARGAFILFVEELMFGMLDVTVQFPLATIADMPAWLLVRGSGGLVGHGLGELGLRVLVEGNGHRGSTFLTLTVGGAVLFSEPAPEGRCVTGAEPACFPSEMTFLAGPTAGFGVEWRL